ncbi:hypothetical protein [Pseudoclavibacter sp. CFCC 11306]|uniref:hypothetical protein n=1 Tax=Pseudoclavibacter sp. CFCC 11306 TaxID=1564493 RepID=UPI00130108A8|nr:hypothetical protein [Pseudoclavibacter sp. CFCC 11306]KAB1658990.1 hypothetical protein F8O09_05340 [Pseudoclavibacter sp. CFCC 11306]
MTETTNKTETAAPFSTLLGARPVLHEKLNTRFAELVTDVVATGKKGTLTLTLTVAPFEGDTDTLVVSDQVRSKRPEIEAKPSILFPTPNGGLTKSDPTQPEFELLGLDKKEN